MISYPSLQKVEICRHYDVATVFYRLLWGPNIHHGLWIGEESPYVAQRQLTECLAREVEVRPGDRVLDVGCGMGSSSRYLARECQCDVTGITISSVQWQWARWAARVRRAERVRFLCVDAERVELPPASFDVVWSIECTEHFFDKPQFFQRASRWLRPGGRVAICAWLAGNTDSADLAKQVYDVCEGFLCPSLGAREDYVQWMQDAGLRLIRYHDWTRSVTRTWEVCRDRVRRMRVHYLAKRIDSNLVRFLDRFETILEAYHTGAMEYGCFVAEKM